MRSKNNQVIQFHDYEPEVEVFLKEVIDGLSASRKTLPCKYFYDERGSHLFNQICQLEEYYLPRAELEIMHEYIEEMAEIIGNSCLLIEYGSGSSMKTRLLLDHLENPAAYVPIDISKEHLYQTSVDLNADYPDLEILPVCADFTAHFELPRSKRFVSRNVVYFPGSTIGNFSSLEALTLLCRMRKLCGPGGGILIGVDLKKDVNILTRAYNDTQQVTKEFNLNLLVRLNRELGADFKIESFDHRAVYNEDEGRIEMHLVSLLNQEVAVNGMKIEFRRSESIETECSYKYSIKDFSSLAQNANLRVDKAWRDKNKLFSVYYLTVF